MPQNGGMGSEAVVLAKKWAVGPDNGWGSS